MTFHIKQSETPADGIRRIAREQIGIVLQAFGDEQLTDEDRVHSLRARCKKMRALLRLPGPLMCERFHVEDERFRAASRRLATIRDAQVQARIIATLDEAADEPETPATPICPDAIQRGIDDMREALAAVDTWPLEIQGFCDLAPGFARTYRKCREAWGRVLHDPNDPHFHKLRKWTKRHWYQVRILERVNKPVLRDRRIRLQVLGEILGSAHDLAVLESNLQPQSNVDRKLMRRAVQRKQDLYRQALSISKEVFAPPADSLVADMSGWWAEWRMQAI
jgi:CHAD domain-containing protein